MLSLFQNKAVVASITPTTAASAAAVVSIADKANTHVSEVEDGVEKVLAEMERRNNPFYVLGRWIGKLIGTVKDESEVYTTPVTKIKREPTIRRQYTSSPANVSVPFSSVFNDMFSQPKLIVGYVENDMGVDDYFAVMEMLAAKYKSLASTSGLLDNGKQLEILGIVPCYGNAVLPQTELNNQQALALADVQDIKLYPGAVATLAVGNNQTAINEMEIGINATHFYGHDGLADVGGWPKPSTTLQTQPGYQFLAQQIFNATPGNAITLVSTATLTELSKTLTELQALDAQNGLPLGSFAKNINAISIMGGCLNQSAGCNAPFNVPDDQKNSEANLFFDAPAAQNVFSICQKYGIKILLAPLDLTQQPGLLWTKAQDQMLTQMNNPAAVQSARVSSVIPYLDVPCFPNGTYPMHDLQAMTALLFPEFYNITRQAYTIGDVGQMTVNNSATDAEKNVYVLTMPVEKQLEFYQKVLPYFQFFPGKKEGLSPLQLALIISAGATVCGLGAFAAVKRAKACKKETSADEENRLLGAEESRGRNVAV